MTACECGDDFAHEDGCHHDGRHLCASCLHHCPECLTAIRDDASVAADEARRGR